VEASAYGNFVLVQVLTYISDIYLDL